MKDAVNIKQNLKLFFCVKKSSLPKMDSLLVRIGPYLKSGISFEIKLLFKLITMQ